MTSACKHDSLTTRFCPHCGLAMNEGKCVGYLACLEAVEKRLEMYHRNLRNAQEYVRHPADSAYKETQYNNDLKRVPPRIARFEAALSWLRELPDEVANESDN